MNAAKKIRLFIEKNESPEQVQVLKDLAAALELGKPFDLLSLYDIDMRYFDAAIELLQDWRFDHHISSRSKLAERLVIEMMQAPSESCPTDPTSNVSSEAAELSATQEQDRTV